MSNINPSGGQETGFQVCPRAKTGAEYTPDPTCLEVKVILLILKRLTDAS